MSISKENETDEKPPASVGLEEALNQMKEAGDIPDGFHMMFFSEDFTLSESCPTNILLRSVGERYGFADTIRRQVFQMPKDQTIITYEFACFTPFEEMKNTMEEIDDLINESFARMVENKTLTTHPKARVQFLLAQPIQNGGEDDDLF